ncbi:Sporulation integral membrane protein YlbJ [Paenibacillus solanacearum]|uniref:Sporulation integral membrane protein YlbJ n=1 Tax=Paenibacillus solanacearum TaxID=2048548 RepID=A0A916NV68_9BACL|nr:nucleoside recognition domain-containing protein [Paenibacillus solanacearum]CAG7603535.1 Sporulation integral membrane protein YlbJ [Paenibacillus solanacearum]
MQRRHALFSPRLATLLLGVSALALVFGIIRFPAQAFQASIQGLHLWWKLVFPTLLPFLILTELLRGLGLLHGLGGLLEPLLRLLFRLPGIGGWVLALGYTTGPQSGAAAIGALRKDGTITREEGERLLSASHVFNPIFIIGVVGVGFLHNATAGLALAFIHYASALLLMLLHRIGARSASLTPSSRHAVSGAGPGWLPRSAHMMRTAKNRDGRTFGKLLGDSVTAGIEQLFIIGGCMMIFSVVMQMISLTHISAAVAAVCSLFGFRTEDSASLFTALLTGSLEPNLGAYAVASFRTLPESAQSALLSLLIAWGGLSTHAQVKSFVAGTDLRFSRFMLSRLQHSVIAFALSFISWKPLMAALSQDNHQPVLAGYTAANAAWSIEKDSLWPLISPMMLQFGTTILILLLLSVFAAFLMSRKH